MTDSQESWGGCGNSQAGRDIHIQQCAPCCPLQARVKSPAVEVRFGLLYISVRKPVVCGAKCERRRSGIQVRQSLWIRLALLLLAALCIWRYFELVTLDVPAVFPLVLAWVAGAACWGAIGGSRRSD